MTATPDLGELLEAYAIAQVDYWIAVDGSIAETDAKTRREDTATAIRKQFADVKAERDLALPFLRDGALAEHHGKCGESSQWDIRRCEDADCLERAHLLEAHGLIPEEWDTYPIPGQTAAS